jgi:hypothetical protein
LIPYKRTRGTKRLLVLAGVLSVVILQQLTLEKIYYKLDKNLVVSQVQNSQKIVLYKTSECVCVLKRHIGAKIPSLHHKF